MSEFLAGCLLGLFAAAALATFLWRRRTARLSALTRSLPETVPANPGPGAGDQGSHVEQWVSAANHDLRQPLQALKLLTTVLDQSEDPAHRREIIDNMGDALRIMEHMLNGLVDLSKLDGGSVVPEPTAMAAGGLLARMKEVFATRAEAAGIDLRIVGSSVAIRSDPRWLERIVAIFLDNAIVHGGATKVLLGCRRRGAGLSIEVHDNGSGLSESDLNRVFLPFVRLGPAGSRGGLGVGLAVARRAADLLGHPLEVASRPSRGCRFAVAAPPATREPMAERGAVVSPTYTATVVEGGPEEKRLVE
jgi:signal transduction histidine kinase